MSQEQSAASAQLERLLQIMQRLRDPDNGCPWDLAQDFRSIAPHTLEECYEVVDAIERDDMAQLRNELGDLLFQVVFYAQLGTERGYFDFAGIADEISTKLLRRHPHVFPEGSLDATAASVTIGSDQIITNWESIKEQERAAKHGDGSLSALEDVPLALGALSRAAKLQKRAAGQGFDWQDSTGVFAKLDEETQELQDALRSGSPEAIEEEFGDLLFTLVNLARHLQLEPETSLRGANRKFELRFRRMEAALHAEGRDMRELKLSELEARWQQAKRE